MIPEFGQMVSTQLVSRTFVSGYPAMRHERTMEFIHYLGRQKALHVKVDDIKSRIARLEQGSKK